MQTEERFRSTDSLRHWIATEWWVGGSGSGRGKPHKWGCRSVTPFGRPYSLKPSWRQWSPTSSFFLTSQNLWTFRIVFNFIFSMIFCRRCKISRPRVGEGAVFMQRGHPSSPRLTALCEDGQPWASMRRVTKSAPDLSYESSFNYFWSDLRWKWKNKLVCSVAFWAVLD